MWYKDLALQTAMASVQPCQPLRTSECAAGVRFVCAAPPWLRLRRCSLLLLYSPIEGRTG